MTLLRRIIALNINATTLEPRPKRSLFFLAEGLSVALTAAIGIALAALWWTA